MTTVADIYGAIDTLAPFASQESWDNSGLLLGEMAQPVGRAVLALDATTEVARRAAEAGADLLITHHPLIFHPLRRVEAASPVAVLLRAGVSLISAHTNLDVAQPGVNDHLAAALGLLEVAPLARLGEEPPSGQGILGRVGKLPQPLSPQAFARLAGERLGMPQIRLASAERPVRLVAVCGGSGGSLVGAAAEAGADLLLTAEVKHDQLLDALAAGLSVVDAGHYATEVVALEPLAARLARLFPEVQFTVDLRGGSVFSTF